MIQPGAHTLTHKTPPYGGNATPERKHHFVARAYSGPAAWQVYLTKRDAIIQALAEGFIGYPRFKLLYDPPHEHCPTPADPENPQNGASASSGLTATVHGGVNVDCGGEMQKDPMYLAKVYAEYQVHCYLPGKMGHLLLVLKDSEQHARTEEDCSKGEEEGQDTGQEEVVGVLLGANSWAEATAPIEKPQELKHLYTTLISPLIKHSYPPSTPSQNTVPPDTLKTYELAPRASFLGVVPAYRGKGAARAMFDAWHAHVEGIHAQGARADDVEECTAALTAMEPGELVSMYEHLGYRVVKRYSAKMRVSGDEFEFVDMLRTWSKVCVSEAEQTV